MSSADMSSIASALAEILLEGKKSTSCSLLSQWNEIQVNDCLSKADNAPELSNDPRKMYG